MMPFDHFQNLIDMVTEIPASEQHKGAYKNIEDFIPAWTIYLKQINASCGMHTPLGLFLSETARVLWSATLSS